MSIMLGAVIIAVLLLSGASGTLVYVRLHPSWHPGDDTPEVPSDSPLRTWRDG